MGWGGGRVLRDRNVAFYLSGVVVSGFGSSAMALAAGVWTKSLTGSDSLAALTTFCVWAPVLLGPLIGTLADRTRRRPLLIWTNLGMAVILLPLLAVRSSDQIWILFVVLTLYGTSSVLLDAAEAALVAAAVPETLRGDFNGLRMTANEGMKLIAPLLGALLFVQFGGRAVALLDAVTFVLAALAFAFIRVSEPAPRPARTQRWSAQAAEGIRYLRHHPVLWRLVLAGAATMGVAGLNGASVYAVVDAGLHRPPAFAGVLYAVQGVGSVVIGLFAGALLRRVPERVFAAAGIMLFALGVALRVIPSVPVVLLASAMIGAGLPCVLIAAMTAVQRVTPGELLGRVAATASTLLFAPNAVALAAGAGLLALVDHRVLLVGAGTVAAAAAAGCLLGSDARTHGAAPAPEGSVPVQDRGAEGSEAAQDSR
ncbi:MFS transporter [Streptomyces sp. HB132]|uniref:MFS transporter n=1 Tax=Streptomyces sp. HB132 TaxID=767388 RepID=UPI001961D5FE|nr:MFS transporter [Streptomyces sp. HB132]MBM7438576.1 MFS family permease [Streptomyces sp. HB132]